MLYTVAQKWQPSPAHTSFHEFHNLNSSLIHTKPLSPNPTPHLFPKCTPRFVLRWLYLYKTDRRKHVLAARNLAQILQKNRRPTRREKCFGVSKCNWPFPLLSAFPVDGDRRFHQQAHQRRGQVPLVGILRDDIQTVDGEETVNGEHHPNEDGARDREAFAAHDTLRRPTATATTTSVPLVTRQPFSPTSFTPTSRPVKQTYSR